MKDLIEKRLGLLSTEYEAGQKMLAEVDAKRANLTQTLLRIEGAMQVLRELLQPNGERPAGALPPDPRS